MKFKFRSDRRLKLSPLAKTFQPAGFLESVPGTSGSAPSDSTRPSSPCGSTHSFISCAEDLDLGSGNAVDSGPADCFPVIRSLLPTSDNSAPSETSTASSPLNFDLGHVSASSGTSEITAGPVQATPSSCSTLPASSNFDVTPSPVAAHTRLKEKSKKAAKSVNKGSMSRNKNKKNAKKKNPVSTNSGNSPGPDSGSLSMPVFPVNSFTPLFDDRSILDVSHALPNFEVADSQVDSDNTPNVNVSFGETTMVPETQPTLNSNSSPSSELVVSDLNLGDDNLGGSSSGDSSPGIICTGPSVEERRRRTLDLSPSKRPFNPFLNMATPPNDNDAIIINNDSPLSDTSISGDFGVGNVNPPSGPGISSPVAPLSPASNPDLASGSALPRNRCPLFNIVENGVLKLLFPILGPLPCTEKHCKALFSGETWNTKKGTLIKHLEKVHKLSDLSVEKWCLICNEDLSSLTHLSRHECLRNTRFCPPDSQIDGLPFKCGQCRFSCQTLRGIRNHYKKHDRAVHLAEHARNPSRSDNPTTSFDLRSRISSRPDPQSPANSSRFSPVSSPVESLPSGSPVFAPPSGCDLSMIPSSEDPDNAEDNSDLDNFIPNPDAASPSDGLILKLRDLLRNYHEDNWEVFEGLVNEFTELAQKTNNIRTDSYNVLKSKPNNRDNPAFIQRLYRRNRRRAVRLIREETQSQCSVDAQLLKDKFFDETPPTPDVSAYSCVTPAPSPPNSRPFTFTEVFQKLKKCENTAPGPDRLTYFHLKKADVEAKALTLIYNYCLKARKIPHAWKLSKTVLIPKSGDPGLPENWRPVALSSTTYKLFASLVAKRISEWVELNDVLSKCQKGFRPFDGTIENNYILKERIQNCRRNKKELCIMLIDIKNAFGSVPHSAIFEALKTSGAGDHFTELITNMYDDNSTQLLTSEGLSDPIDVKVGVKQGCPLSGPMFNLAINPIFQIIQALRDEYHVLGYADDLVIFEDNPEQLQFAIDKLAQFTRKIGLDINPRKCHSIHIDPIRAACKNTIFEIDGTSVPALEKFEITEYLGKPIGFNIFNDNEKIDEFIDYGTKIMTSHLAPWQRIDALKSFFFPSLSYAMRTDQFDKGDWKRIDQALKPHLKSTLNLPDRACTDYIYGNPKDGLFGVPLAAEDSDIAKIDTAFKLLMSIDPNVKIHAWDDLKTCVLDRVPNPSFTDFADFLSGVRYGDSDNRFTSVWARARAASNRLGVSWFITEDRKVSIKIDQVTVTDRRNVFKSLRDHLRTGRSKSLASKPHQGKTLACLSLSKASTHFHREGDYLRFADWRWIHKARLGLVKLNAYAENDPDKQKCRWCGYEKETLPHVINCCERALARKITMRHNRIVARLKKAALGRWSVLRENQFLGAEGLRPDLVLVDKQNEEVLILDVTMPFESKLENFHRARKEKVLKYTNLVNELKGRYRKVSCEAVVVGSLGSWDNKNDRIIHRLCSKKYAALMRKLIVSDSVRASRDIFFEHVTGIEQIDNRSRFYEIGPTDSAPPTSRYGRKKGGPSGVPGARRAVVVDSGNANGTDTPPIPDYDNSTIPDYDNSFSEQNRSNNSIVNCITHVNTLPTSSPGQNPRGGESLTNNTNTEN